MGLCDIKEFDVDIALGTNSSEIEISLEVSSRQAFLEGGTNSKVQLSCSLFVGKGTGY